MEKRLQVGRKNVEVNQWRMILTDGFPHVLCKELTVKFTALHVINWSFDSSGGELLRVFFFFFKGENGGSRVWTSCTVLKDLQINLTSPSSAPHRLWTLAQAHATLRRGVICSSGEGADLLLGFVKEVGSLRFKKANWVYFCWTQSRREFEFEVVKGGFLHCVVGNGLHVTAVRGQNTRGKKKNPHKHKESLSIETTADFLGLFCPFTSWKVTHGLMIQMWLIHLRGTSEAPQIMDYCWNIKDTYFIWSSLNNWGFRHLWKPLWMWHCVSHEV